MVSWFWVVVAFLAGAGVGAGGWAMLRPGGGSRVSAQIEAPAEAPAATPAVEQAPPAAPETAPAMAGPGPESEAAEPPDQGLESIRHATHGVLSELEQRYSQKRGVADDTAGGRPAPRRRSPRRKGGQGP